MLSTVPLACWPCQSSRLQATETETGHQCFNLQFRFQATYATWGSPLHTQDGWTPVNLPHCTPALTWVCISRGFPLPMDVDRFSFFQGDRNARQVSLLRPSPRFTLTPRVGLLLKAFGGISFRLLRSPTRRLRRARSLGGSGHCSVKQT